MNTDRLAQLLKFLEEDPHDPFILYAIATEYRTSDNAKALAYYEQLLAEHEDYVGTYYHAAKLYEELGQHEAAERTYKKGMHVSRKQGNLHAFSELQQAYNKMMGLDYEDD
ncbi:tetratricopeptide repeat protein [Pontibacter sp. 172403-2]|uniref:tetratricopeptide repeat protein n=1 Tax=Pontibacter rufus TaxID=2791028 RepID=UPI0018AF6B65|nr:tetratricopeptide repeat protein [Pontibacter sp. 172403-2]MBF9254405.1 tetratricopeptide repeat protein [Pontibacter sp. 172403-2]